MKKLIILALVLPVFCWGQKDSSNIHIGLGAKTNIINPTSTNNEINPPFFTSYGVFCFANYSFNKVVITIEGGYSIFSRNRKLSYAQYKQNGTISNVALLTNIKLLNREIKIFAVSGIKTSFFNYNSSKLNVLILNEDKLQNNVVLNIPLGIMSQKNKFFAQINYLFSLENSTNNIFLEFKLAYAFAYL